MPKIIIRLPNWLGDAIMATAAVRRFREQNPEPHITLLGLPATLSVFENTGFSDEHIPYERDGRHFGWSGMLRLASELRPCRYDCGYLLTNSFSSALLFALARIPRQVGYAGHWRRAFLDEAVKAQPEGTHQAERYAHLLLGEVPRDLTIGMTVTQEEAQKAEIILKEQGIDSAPLIGLAPGAAYGPAKRWLPERFGELARQAYERTRARSVLLGSNQEKMLAIKALKHAGDEAAVDLTGKTTLRQLYAILQRCRVVVSNDSGLMHATAAVGTPVVALFGPTRPGETAPYTTHYQIIQKDLPCAPCMRRTCPLKHHNCMKQIEPQEVWRLIQNHF